MYLSLTGGMRNWTQVLCNGGVAAEMSVLYMIDVGCAEKLIDFSSHFTPSWYSLAVMGALCCSCGDTFSSEIGSVFGSSREATLITNFQSVPRGDLPADTFLCLWSIPFCHLKTKLKFDVSVPGWNLLHSYDCISVCCCLFEKKRTARYCFNRKINFWLHTKPLSCINLTV